MSRKTNIEVTCPACSTKYEVSIWQSINTTLDPEMKQAVRNRSAFQYTCPECGNQTYLSYGFLYHQMEDRILIYLASNEADAEDMYKMLTDTDTFGPESFVNQDYLIRILMSDNQFREKLFIFDAGLDDRIIEIYKMLILAIFQKDSGEESNYDQIELYFYTDDDGKHYIHILADKEPKGVVEMLYDVYEKICRDYMPELKDIRKEDPFVDRQWALETMHSLKSQKKTE